MADEYKVSDHFTSKDSVVETIYKRLLVETRKFGPVLEEPKKTSIHLMNKSAFAGVRTQNAALILNVKSAAPIRDKRFKKSEQVSASRYHQELKLTSPIEVDALLVKWLKDAYTISG